MDSLDMPFYSYGLGQNQAWWEKGRCMTDGIVLPANGSGERLPPIRIAFCITDLDVGGAERMFVELVTRLDRHRWEPRVYCLSGPGALVERLQAAEIPVTCFGAKSVRHIGVVQRLATELKKFSPALIQCFLFHGNFVGRLAAWRAGVSRVVCGIRVAERRSRVPLWLDRLTQGFVDHNVCVSRAVAEFSIHKAKLKASKISVIPNAVEFDHFANAVAVDRSSLGLSAAPLVLFVGRLDPQKAPFVLLEAFAHLLERHLDWQLLFVGEGSLRASMEEWITRHCLGHRIRIAGWRADVPELLKAADLLTLPSLWEGMPNIVLEAMAAGLPVVVSRVEGTDELIQDGETGLLVTPGSSIELERQIEAVLTNAELSLQLRTTAQLAVHKLFTMEHMVSAYEQLYARLIAKCAR
ncbi:MAG: glycosyltransferase [Planctomycetaceae bacterium]|nr:glycosyltransferase [Planctomycetaceae bacterium]